MSTSSGNSFDSIFEEAAAEFNTITGQTLRSTGNPRLEDVIDQLERINAPDPAESKKKARTKEVVGRVMKGLQVLNGVAAQAASAMFPYSNVCFNAIGFLLEIPKSISDFWDGLGALFETIDAYLVRFRILRRADQDGGMAQEIITSTKQIMTCFVRICARCYHSATGGKRVMFKLALKAVFLGEGSKVKGELDNFERLTRRQDALTGAVTLEAVLKTNKQLLSMGDLTDSINLAVQNMGETVKRIDSKVTSLNQNVQGVGQNVGAVREGVEFLVKDTSEKKEWDELVKKLGFEDEEEKKRLQEQDNIQTDIQRRRIDHIGDWLNQASSYRHWKERTSNEHILMLSGGPKSGKTYLAFRIVESLLRDAAKDRIVVGRYCFSRFGATATTKDRSLDSMAVAVALKSMALQIAQQNWLYRKELQSSIKSTDEQLLKPTGKSISVKEVWRVLRFAAATSESTYTFMLIFDGLDQLTEEAADELLTAVACNERDSMDACDPEYLRVLVAGADSFLNARKAARPDLLGNVPTVITNESNGEDMKTFVDYSLRNDSSLQELDTQRSNDEELSKAFNIRVPEIAAGDFSKIQSKLSRLKEAMDADTEDDLGHIKVILNEDAAVDSRRLAQKALDDLNATLKGHDIRQLNQVLRWLVYMSGTCTVDMLEAIVFLSGTGSQLRPLAKKLNDSAKYGRIMRVTKQYGREYVEIEESVLSTLKQQNIKKNGEIVEIDATRANITMTIQFQQAGQDDIRKFFWDLSKTATFNFATFTQTKQIDLRERIYVDAQESYSTIIEQAIDVLTDEPQAKTQALSRWAVLSLPEHLDMTSLKDELGRPISFRNRKKILRGLLTLFTDVQTTLKHWSLQAWSVRFYWLDEDSVTSSLTRLLQDEDTINTLKPKHKRRLQTLNQESNGRGGFWKALTLEIAKEWLLKSTWDAEDAFNWIDGYITLQSRPEPKPDQAENELQAKDERPAEEIVATQNDQGRIEEQTAEPSERGNVDPTEVNGEGAENSQACDNSQALGDLGNSEPADLTNKERIDRAAEWVRKELSITSPEATWYLRLSDTYLWYSLDREGLEVLEHGCELLPKAWAIREQLARCYAERRDYKNATKQLEAAITCIKESDAPDKSQRLNDDYMKLASQHILIGNANAGISFYAAALEQMPKDYIVRAEYLTVLQNNNLDWKVKEFLHNVSSEPSGEGELNELANIFYVLAKDQQEPALEQFFTTMKRNGMLELAMTSIETALEYAKSRTEVNGQQVACLTLLEANAMALRASDQDDNLRVIQKLEEVCDHYEALEVMGYFHWIANQLRSSYCFQMAMDGSERHVRQLKTLSRKLSSSWGVLNTITYVVSYKARKQELEEAKQILYDEMKDALELLSNDDVSDDWIGFTRMADIFEKVGDDENALTAWSLVGPEDAKPTGQDANREISNGTNDETVTEAKDEAEEQAPPEQIGEIRRAGPWGQVCDGRCGVAWTFADDFVRCKICPQTTFCRDCHGKLRQGSPNFHWCDKRHDFLDVPPWPKETHPLGSDKLVKIGGWASPDGEVIEIEAWLNRVRAQWNLDTKKGDGEQQDGEQAQESPPEGISRPVRTFTGF